MKILLISDTHGKNTALQALLGQYAKKVELVCHLGDHAGDLLNLQSMYPSLNMATVAGNCDYSLSFEWEQILTLSGKRILLTHGHMLGVKQGLDRLAYYAREKGADACFFGHTHMPEVTAVGDVFLMNPGSLGEPRGGNPASFGVVEITPEGKIFGEVLTFA